MLAVPYDSLTNAKLSLAETMNVAPEPRDRQFTSSASEIFSLAEILARLTTCEANAVQFALASLDRGSPAFD